MSSTKGKAGYFDIFAGEQVKHYRALQGISQEKLAKKIGVTFQQVQKYENGSNRMALSTAAKVAHVLEVDIEVFFPEEYRVGKQTVIEKLLSERETLRNGLAELSQELKDIAKQLRGKK